MNERNDHAALFEHRFWLQILGDHARFILTNLSPRETEEVDRAQQFMAEYDTLLEAARRDDLASSQLDALNRMALQQTSALREFKLHLLRRHLTEKIEFWLPPSFLNHMVNELEEYQRILRALLKGEGVPRFHPVHHHLLWLLDAAGHATALEDRLDAVEKLLKKRSMKFTKHFEALYMKAIEAAGFLRTNLIEFPALSRLNREAELEIKLFQGFLLELEEMELTQEVLSTLLPLLPDHMFREECYYLTKLAQVSEVQHPDCDPTKPRIE
jgi:hypothetical protein